MLASESTHCNVICEQVEPWQRDCRGFLIEYVTKLWLSELQSCLPVCDVETGPATLKSQWSTDKEDHTI